VWREKSDWSPAEPVGERSGPRSLELLGCALRRFVGGLGGAVAARLAVGEPAETILRVAEESGCDLIVLGTHGRSGMSYVLTGSIAQQVVQKAPCPVLTFRAPGSSVTYADFSDPQMASFVDETVLDSPRVGAQPRSRHAT
jgi:hypothetical protein